MATISATFQANFDQFVAAVKSAEGALNSVSGSARSLGTAIATSLAGTEIRRFAGDLQVFAKEFIGAFAEEEAAVIKLSTALKANGTLTPELMGQYKALGAEFQRTTAFSDDLMFGMTALMVQVGNVGPTQMRAALTAAANLSAGLGIDLQAATMAVAKGFEGGTTALLKMVPSLKSVIKEGASMSEVLAIINERFGGQAQAQLETYNGKMGQLSNQMSDFKEQIGELMVNGLTPLMNAFASMPQFLQTAIVAVVAVGTALAPLALSFMAVSAAVGPLLPMIGTALVAAIGLLTWPIAGAIAAVGALVIAFYKWDAIVGIVARVYEGVKYWLVDKFAGIVQWVQEKIAAIIAAFQAMYMAVSGGSIVPDMLKGIESEFKKLDRVMVKPVIQATGQAVSGFKTLGQSAVGTGPAPLALAGGGSTTVINVHGNVLSTQAELAKLVQDALVKARTAGGGRMPA